MDCGLVLWIGDSPPRPDLLLEHLVELCRGALGRVRHDEERGDTEREGDTREEEARLEAPTRGQQST